MNRYVYVIPASVIFILSLAGNLYFGGKGYFTVAGLQLSFWIVCVFTAIFLIFSSLAKKLSTPLVLRALMLPGICLRICYTLFTDAGTRTYDVYRDTWGHLDYIKYIAKNFSLPPVNECQTYHPPVHHIISALVLDVSKLFTQKEFFQLKAIQLTMVLFSSLTLVFFYKILKELKCSDTAILAGVALFAFHPTNIYFSSRINNDNVLLFFYTLAFYFLIRWINSNAMKDIVLLSLGAALAMLTKFSGIMLVPLIAAAFAAALFRNRSRYMVLLRQYAVFGFIYIPLSMSYQLRNYILFHQGFGYVPSLGRGFTPTLYNLLSIPWSHMIAYPFNNGGLNGGEFFVEFLLKSSLFGEWPFPGLERLALVMLFLAMALAVILLAYILWMNKQLLKGHRLIFLLNLVIPILLMMKLRTDLPIACAQDFRYAAPVLISASFFIGEAVSLLNTSRLKFLKYLVIACLVSFCTLSSVFVLFLGYYN